MCLDGAGRVQANTKYIIITTLARYLLSIAILIKISGHFYHRNLTTHTIYNFNMSTANSNSRTTAPRGGRGGSGSAPPKKESNLELTKMIDAKVHVKCLGGREIVGVLKGYDELVNLVLDDADEYLRG